jgi:Tannase and feruloyl esterase
MQLSCVGLALLTGLLLPLVGAAAETVDPPKAIATTPPAAAASERCDSLAKLPLPTGSVTAVEAVAAGTYTAPDKTDYAGLPAFCRVQMSLRPSTDSDIKVEVWLPLSGWNDKFEGIGNGGYAGVIRYAHLSAGLKRNFAVANTDMGTAPSKPLDGNPLVGHPEKWVDWGYRATHEMTIAAKTVVQAFYGEAPKRSYFTGCSTGGQQALSEAQRYPDDYDGIVAGSPAMNRTHIHANAVWVYQAAQAVPGGALPVDKLTLLHKAVVEACGTLHGGLKSDPFLLDPSLCHFDPAKLQCNGTDTTTCLTADQVTTAEKIYSGLRNPRTHQQIEPGLPRGSEVQSIFGIQYIEGVAPFMEGAGPPAKEPVFDGLFRWVFGADWDWKSFDFDKDMTRVDDTLGPILNATNPDLSTFQAHGHKLMIYHGWADPLVNPFDTVTYYQAVAAHQKDTKNFARLFMVPGMDHCAVGAGQGPSVFGGLYDPPPHQQDAQHDLTSALMAWVEDGVAPEKIVATRYVENNPAKGIAMQRPLCPYPQVAKYSGAGDINDAGNFTCAAE